jgi:predicted TPR repeat methyltransferase
MSQGPDLTGLALAQHLQAIGRVIEAQSVCRQILATRPHDVDALQLLAALLQKKAQWLQAQLALEQLAVIRPGDGAVLAKLGDVLMKLGRPIDAVAAWRRASHLAGADPDLHYRLGCALAGLGCDEEAMVELAHAQKGPHAHDPAIVALAPLLHRHGRLDALRELLADAVFRLSFTGQARPMLELWHQLLPEDAVPRFRLAAMSGQNAPAQADVAYVTDLFDHYAGSFDKALAALSYRAPTLIEVQLARTLGPPVGALRVLDAGCGTGLCGRLVRPYARHLTGVDLSAGMVAKARDRGAYDDLEVAELSAFLMACTDTYDLIVSADTLVYFGDLMQVLTGAARTLVAGGWLAFSVERLDVSVSAGYRLNTSGRFSHSKDYLVQALATAGLRCVSLTEETLRMEGGQPVAGCVVLAQRHVPIGSVGFAAAQHVT